MVNKKDITVPDFYKTYINALQENNLHETWPTIPAVLENS